MKKNPDFLNLIIMYNIKNENKWTYVVFLYIFQLHFFSADLATLPQGRIFVSLYPVPTR